MSEAAEPALQESVEIGAGRQAVWELISDVRRMPDWSPQVNSTRLRAGHDEVAPGAEFTNHNSDGKLQWITHGEIVRFVPGEELAFRIAENWVIWSLRLEALGGGRTRLTQRREAPNGISPKSLDLTERFMGGRDGFTARLRDGMRETLAGIKAAAESDAAPGDSREDR